MSDLQSRDYLQPLKCINKCSQYLTYTRHYFKWFTCINSSNLQYYEIGANVSILQIKKLSMDRLSNLEKVTNKW